MNKQTHDNKELFTEDELEDIAEGNAMMYLIVDEEETHSQARKTGFKDGYRLGYEQALALNTQAPAMYKALNDILVAIKYSSTGISFIDRSITDKLDTAKSILQKANPK